MRLVDADVADKWMRQNNAFIDAAILKAIPTIDAVPVVRCRECENYDENGDCISLDLRIGIHSDRKPAAQAPCFSYGVSGDIAAFH